MCINVDYNGVASGSGWTAHGHASAAQARAQAARAAGGSGLVPSKTSPLEILFDKAQSARKRVKRLRRSVWAAGHLHGLADHGHRPPVAWMVTLTYVGVDDWRADHISKASEQYRRHCARHRVPCRYLWVAELQKRGAVHYHLIAWLPKGVRMPHWDRDTTTAGGRQVRAFWSHGMTNVEQARTGVGYLMKYLPASSTPLRCRRSHATGAHRPRLVQPTGMGKAGAWGRGFAPHGFAACRR